MTTSKFITNHIKNPYLSQEQYHAMYEQSIRAPMHFWHEQAEHFISWFSKWQSVQTGGFIDGNIRWFVGGALNASYNCIDRHLPAREQQVAILWEGDEAQEIRRITYQQLHEEVCRFAHALTAQGIKQGDRVCIYMPMIPEVAVAMLACTRIGAVHSVVFAGFSPDALSARILDADARLIITADEGLRGGKVIPLKNNVDTALAACPNVNKVIVVRRTGNPIPWHKKRDLWYHESLAAMPVTHPPISMDANSPMFILYTSGSTGKPKGIVHALGGYLVYAAMTHHYVFNYHAPDVFWCTADVGWITGHTYAIYGPLMNGATTFMFEGTPNYPNHSRFWEIVDRHQVNILYTAPTAIRALRREGDIWVKRTKRQSLNLLGTVGEPINPDVWEWYHDIVGEGRCPVIDTWWQTETGGILIAPIPGVTPLKPGSAAQPFFGIEPAIVNESGEFIKDEQAGSLVIRQPWPGLATTIHGNQERYMAGYFKEVPGAYLTGDGAHRDEDGYYWISGRNDDVIKVSGHRLGTAEIESAFLRHSAVSEAAAVAIPHEIKGQGIYVYITLKEGIEADEELARQLFQHIRKTIGAIAAPEAMQWAEQLPKTRSGKIMRRLLRKIACDETEDLGDTSTLAEPAVIDALIRNRKNAIYP
ncbi:acetate--CoA ligase [Legionella septentrionalis]|uniref:acetate--CoA ligase n=1 Tax=Legionella septentrionalis TaxID=2498109 RepID=UPI000F8EFE8C|nr:acetate--CoA ligase [Legionella septentrionalis]RUQ96449.1 acetate--CoA ligase [Legionella septentrionalis]